MSEQNDKARSLTSETSPANLHIKRRGFLLSMSWTLPGLYLAGWSANRAQAWAHTDTHTDSHTDGHLDVPGYHEDNGHGDATGGPPQHNDLQHQDRAHADGTYGGGHYDVGHGDQAHVDTPSWPGGHVDNPAHSDSNGHSDGPLSTHADIHGDSHSDTLV